MRSRFARLGTVALLALAPARSPVQEVLDGSCTLPDGTRVMQHQIVVPGSPEEVWAAFTTAEGLKTWAVPVVHVDFRVGGISPVTGARRWPASSP